MKNPFCNTITHDKLRGLLTKKKVTSLLILTAIGAAIFATPTVSFARGYLSNSSHQFSLATPTKSSQRSLNPTVSLKAIRMLDKTHGWTLTSTSILKTADGGVHWQNVTPKGQIPGINAQGEFLTTQIAWVVWQSIQSSAGQTQTITILHTVNGGASWQTVTITTQGNYGLADAPRFINTQQGWLVLAGDPGMGSMGLITYQTTNGGHTWTLVSGPVQIAIGSTVSFSNAHLGWLGLNWPGNQPVIGKTTNGGKSWQQQMLPAPANVAEIGYVQTTAAVLIGADGILPTHISAGTNLQDRLDLYTTHDTGASWTAGPLATFDSTDVYALDAQHVWAEETNRNVLHFSSNGGKTWAQLAQTPHHFGALNFIDIHNGWAIDDTGQLYQTTDGGTNWQPINSSIS